MQEEYVERVGTVRSLESSGPLEFHFPPASQALTDLSQVYLKLKVKVTRDGVAIKTVKGLTDADLADPSGINWAATGTEKGAPGVDAKLSVCNAYFDSLFSQVSFYCNEILVENQMHYHLIAYLQNVLSWDREAKSTALKSLTGWVSDEPGKYDEFDNAATRVRQRDFILNGRVCHLKSKLNLGTMSTTHGASRLLPNHVSLKIVLHRNPARVPLHYMGQGDPDGIYAVEIVGAECELRRVNLAPAALREMETKLSKSMQTFPFARSQLKTFNLSSGQSEVTLENMYNGVLVSILPGVEKQIGLFLSIRVGCGVCVCARVKRFFFLFYSRKPSSCA